MLKKLFGAGSAVAAIAVWFGRGTIETWFFEKVLAVTPGPAWEFVVEYGPPALFAAAAMWLLGRSSQSFSWWDFLPEQWSRVHIDDAARIAYEAAERAGVVDLTTHPQSAPDVRLRHYITVFLVDDEAVVLGAKPPSTQLVSIPLDIRKGLYPVVGQNRLDQLSPENVIAYTDVRVRRRDLSRIIREYPAEARKFAREHRIR